VTQPYFFVSDESELQKLLFGMHHCHWRINVWGSNPAISHGFTFPEIKAPTNWTIDSLVGCPQMFEKEPKNLSRLIL